MADDSNAYAYVSRDRRDILDFLIKTDRPVHKSICLGKVPCPHNDCGATKDFFEESRNRIRENTKNNLQLQPKDFFEESGICHHFRIKHKEQFTTSEMNHFVLANCTMNKKQSNASSKYLISEKQ